jgi:Loader and inhibitor of phage G40P.
MTRNELNKLFLIINNAYQNFAIDEVKMAFWHNMLEDFSFEIALSNLRHHVYSEKYPPTIADIRKPPLDVELTNYLQLKEATQHRLKLMEEWHHRAVLKGETIHD